MANILKHEQSPVPLYLAKADEDMNVAPKSELANILMTDIVVPSHIPDTDLNTCVMIDGYALTQGLGKPIDAMCLVILQRYSLSVSRTQQGLTAIWKIASPDES